MSMNNVFGYIFWWIVFVYFITMYLYIILFCSYSCIACGRHLSGKLLFFDLLPYSSKNKFSIGECIAFQLSDKFFLHRSKGDFTFCAGDRKDCPALWFSFPLCLQFLAELYQKINADLEASTQLALPCKDTVKGIEACHYVEKSSFDPCCRYTAESVDLADGNRGVGTRTDSVFYSSPHDIASDGRKLLDILRRLLGCRFAQKFICQ